LELLVERFYVGAIVCLKKQPLLVVPKAFHDVLLLLIVQALNLERNIKVLLILVVVIDFDCHLGLLFEGRLTFGFLHRFLLQSSHRLLVLNFFLQFFFCQFLLVYLVDLLAQVELWLVG
jgi:hypothetical protein